MVDAKYSQRVKRMYCLQDVYNSGGLKNVLSLGYGRGVRVALTT